MITPEYCRLMARYNRWQSENLVAAADTLSDDARRQDRGAFFGSIMGTFNHLLWGDTVWFSRFTDAPPPEVDLPDSARLVPDWDDFKLRRRQMDEGILDWTERMAPPDVLGVMRYHSTAFGGTLERAKPVCLVHFFNHQTHHRGQIHAMLTAAGARPGITDLVGLPDLAAAAPD